MPTDTQVTDVVSGMQQPFLVAGSRAVRTQDNRRPNYDVHSNFQFVQGNVSDFQNKQAFVFIHGYNTTSSEALVGFKRFFELLTESIEREPGLNLTDAGFCGFTWPGDTGTIYFNEAQEYAHHSGVALYKLIGALHEAGASSVSLVSHSLGAHVLLRALSILGERLYRERSSVSRVKHALLLGPAVEEDTFERPDFMDEYHFPEAVFGMEFLHMVASRSDEVLSSAFYLNEKDRALGYKGPESMSALQSLARRVKEVLGEEKKFIFELHDFSPRSAVIMNPQLWVHSHGDYWKTQEQMNYYINLLTSRDLG
ncbi:MAG: alpha/beta hydrolase [Cyanobacteria bacterium P01_D01_bin.36]